MAIINIITGAFVAILLTFLGMWVYAVLWMIVSWRTAGEVI